MTDIFSDEAIQLCVWNTNSKRISWERWFLEQMRWPSGALNLCSMCHHAINHHLHYMSLTLPGWVSFKSHNFMTLVFTTYNNPYFTKFCLWWIFDQIKIIIFYISIRIHIRKSDVSWKQIWAVVQVCVISKLRFILLTLASHKHTDVSWPVVHSEEMLWNIMPRRKHITWMINLLHLCTIGWTTVGWMSSWQNVCLDRAKVAYSASSTLLYP